MAQHIGKLAHQAIIFFILFSHCSFSQQITVYTASNSGLPDNTVRVIEKAPDGSIWIGTDWGIAHFDGNSWESFNSSNVGLPDNSIRSIAFDNENRVWIGTFVGGLAVFENDSVIKIFNPANSPLPDDHVRAIVFDSSGVWIGTTGGLVYLKDTTWMVYDNTNSILFSNNITSLHVDAMKVVWAGTINGGLLRINEKLWTLYRTINSPIPDNTILDIAHDSQNTLWLASPAGGLIAFNGTSWLSLNTINSNSPTDSYNGLVISQGDTVYLSSTINGLAVYNGGTSWDNLISSNSALPQNELLCIEAGDSGCYWIGTSSMGLVKFCKEDTTVGLGSIEENIFSVYPNSAFETLIIKATSAIPYTITVYDLAGRKLISQKYSQPNVSLPLNTLCKGVYLIKVWNGERQQTVKFLKN